LPVVGLAAVFSLFIVGMGVRAMRRAPVTGAEEMVGLIGVARTTLAPQGHLSIHGEIWEAVSDAPLNPGDHAQVTRVEGLTLYVRPVLPKKEAI
ncbi:MAG TPA: NfeD family protein, partial [Nitrospiraceae bacterium]|nr:NfeD family protein [Nitrospiraceae bacterium]